MLLISKRPHTEGAGEGEEAFGRLRKRRVQLSVLSTGHLHQLHLKQT